MSFAPKIAYSLSSRRNVNKIRRLHDYSFAAPVIREILKQYDLRIMLLEIHDGYATSPVDPSVNLPPVKASFLVFCGSVAFREMSHPVVPLLAVSSLTAKPAPVVAPMDDTDDLLDDFSIPDDTELIDENTPLHNAASRGHTNYLDALIQAGASPNSRDQYGNTLLHLAAMHGHMRSVQLLLDRGARTNAKNKYGNTLLHVAALNGHTDMCMFLIEKGLKVGARNNAGSIPLHYSSMMGRLECMKLLIKLGSDVNAKNSTGSTPLHAASLNGYGECMELLVDKGADINQKNVYDYTPLNYADSNSRGHSPIYNTPQDDDD